MERGIYGIGGFLSISRARARIFEPEGFPFLISPTGLYPI